MLFKFKTNLVYSLLQVMLLPISDHFKHDDAVLANFLAFAFGLLGYVLGVSLLFSPYWIINILGVLLTAQALITSAYLLHEFTHRSIFKSPAMNARWGVIMCWVHGSCYSSFDEIRSKHMHHHVDRADVISFDIKRFIIELPTPAKNIIKALEWAYIPAAEIIMHYSVMILPFTTAKWHHKRARLLLIAAIRAAMFGVMAWFSIKAWLLYLLAYCIMLTALRFADSYQHTYEVFTLSDFGINKSGKQEVVEMSDGKVRDATYEQANTYSNLMSVNHPWLNLIFLNFPYHNAHHEKPIVPWYQLPQLHEKLYGNNESVQKCQDSVTCQVLPMASLLKSYHQHRVTRLESDDYGKLIFIDSASKSNDSANKVNADHFIGAVGISFLTAI